MTALLKKSTLQQADAFMALFALHFDYECGPYIMQEAANGGYLLTTHSDNRVIIIRGNAVAVDCIDFYMGYTQDFTFHGVPKETGPYYAQFDASQYHTAANNAYQWLVNHKRIEKGGF
jgi:hypothetical protein